MWFVSLAVSSVTHAAIVQLLESIRADVIFRNQSLSALELVRWRFPLRVENLIGGPQVFLRRIVTIETPAHIKRVRLPGDRHTVHRPMAGGAADAFLNVDAMIEEDKIRSLIDALPMNRLARGEALANGRSHRRVFPHLRVAGHAGFGWRHAGEGGFFDRCMAIAAIQPETGHVVFMAERGRLSQRHVDAGRIR